MDTLETISADTSLEDELNFLKFVLKDRDIRLISRHVTEKGPTYLSLNDLPKLKQSKSIDNLTFLLWNTRCPNPLCWELYLGNRDSEWTIVRRGYATWKPPQTREDFLAIHHSFQQHGIKKDTFQDGTINRLLSPVIEISVRGDWEKAGYTIITAEFSNVVKDVWVTWDGFEDTWIHENRDLTQLFEQRFTQPPEFIQWQETLFAWIRKNWQSKILPHESYRY